MNSREVELEDREDRRQVREGSEMRQKNKIIERKENKTNRRREKGKK